MSISVSRLTRFKSAMESIYGPFKGASNWTPPLLTEGCGRYLWTDAFATLNFMTLSKETGEHDYLEYARRLIDTVHNTLGKTRDGKARLPGATDEHPLDGGLRIGKAEETGPDGDGQYHHYLTLWMFALNRFTHASGEPKYNDLAIELAKAIHPRFVYNRGSARPRMYWKISMDMSKPLVRSEGNLDPIDGYIMFNILQTTAAQKDPAKSNVLEEEIMDYKKIVETKWQYYSSDDSLDLGMTLWTSHWLYRSEDWAAHLSRRAFKCLEELAFVDHFFDLSLQYRLAFRDFGTAMGIRCYDHEEGSKWLKLADHIVDSWDQGGRLKDMTRRELQPITMVMFAAAICPGPFRKDYL